MEIDRSGVPVLPLSFGLLVVGVVLLGRWGFGIEWEAGQLALALVGMLLGVGLLLAWRRRRE